MNACVCRRLLRGAIAAALRRERERGINSSGPEDDVGATVAVDDGCGAER